MAKKIFGVYFYSECFEKEILVAMANTETTATIIAKYCGGRYTVKELPLTRLESIWVNSVFDESVLNN